MPGATLSASPGRTRPSANAVLAKSPPPRSKKGSKVGNKGGVPESILGIVASGTTSRRAFMNTSKHIKALSLTLMKSPDRSVSHALPARWKHTCCQATTESRPFPPPRRHASPKIALRPSAAANANAMSRLQQEAEPRQRPADAVTSLLLFSTPPFPDDSFLFHCSAIKLIISQNFQGLTELHSPTSDSSHSWLLPLPAPPTPAAPNADSSHSRPL